MLSKDFYSVFVVHSVLSTTMIMTIYVCKDRSQITIYTFNINHIDVMKMTIYKYDILQCHIDKEGIAFEQYYDYVQKGGYTSSHTWNLAFTSLSHSNRNEIHVQPKLTL